MEKKFSGCEVLDIAVQIEKNGISFYKALYERASSKEAKKVLEILVAEEKEHEKFFRELFGQSCSHDPEGAYPQEYYSYMRTLASSFMFSDEEEQALHPIDSFKEGIEAGMQMEKDSILFYLGIRENVPEKDKEKLDRVISAEKKHLSKLCSMKGGEDGECQNI